MSLSSAVVDMMQFFIFYFPLDSILMNLESMLPMFNILFQETVEFIEYVLGVEVFYQAVAGSNLVGCYSALSNRGGLVRVQFLGEAPFWIIFLHCHITN